MVIVSCTGVEDWALTELYIDVKTRRDRMLIESREINNLFKAVKNTCRISVRSIFIICQ